MAKYKYIGDGSWIPGIPTRDISSDELSKEQLQVVKDSPMYQEVKSSKSSKTKEDTNERSNQAQKDSVGS